MWNFVSYIMCILKILLGCNVCRHVISNSRGNHTVPIVDSLEYMAHAGSTAQFGWGARSAYWAIVNTLFSASLLPRDTWGNVKVPMLEHFKSFSNCDGNGWFSMDKTGAADVPYSSLVGIPISGTNSLFIDYAFSMESQYIQLKCSLVNYTLTAFDSPLGFLNSSGPWFGNATGSGSSMYWGTNTTERLNTNPNDVQEPLNFVFSLYWPRQIPNFSKCNITTTYVEMEVGCPTSTTCATSRIRGSKQQHAPTAFTQMDLPSYAGVPNWLIFAEAFVTSIGSKQETASPSMIESYLVDPLNPATVPVEINNLAQATSNDEYVFRLNQMINTYWTSTTGMAALSNGIDTINNAKGYIGLLPTNTSSTKVTKKSVAPVIHAHDGWIAALCIASGVMVVAILIPTFFRHFLRRAPDIMMNISSLGTRHNPYFPLPEKESFLDAADRARLLRDCSVRFGDIG